MRRECGDCQLCCKLLPVEGINKRANTRCKHQSHAQGCKVYHKPEEGFPWECGLWSCVWLQNNDAAELRRPDRAHYVIDILPDYVTYEDADGQKVVIPVVQIWCDPKYPNAHRDPELRAWLLRRKGFAGIVRYSAWDAIMIFPPYLMDTGRWEEKSTNLQQETHTFGQVLQALAAP